MNIRDYLSKEEIALVTRKSDAWAWAYVVGNWAGIALIFALLALYPHPLTILAALVLFAGRQLGLSVLMHDCGHRTLFRTAWLNDVVGQWLCALPVMNDQPSYARGHLEHHRKAGTSEDPDLSNYGAYPVPRASFRRKVIRDLTGQTGFKLISYIVRGASGILTPESRGSAAPFVKEILVQAVILAVLAACGIAWAYVVWAVAYMTTFMLVIRIRQVAEHAAVPDLMDLDPRKNTRTVDAPWWQRIIFAPCGVNFHMEHHLLASVPCYRLRELRALLRSRGALDGVPEFRGYGAVLRHAVV